MKKIIKYFKFFLVVVVLIPLVACTTNTTKEKAKLPIQTNGSEQEGVFAFEALSTVNLLVSQENVDINLSTNVTTSPTQLGIFNEKMKKNGNVITEAQIDKIDNYLAMFEQFLNGNHPITVDVIESDLEGYSSKMVIKSSTIIKEEIEYVLYYNEVEQSEENDEITFEGIMHVGDLVYTVKGGKEINDVEELKVISYLDKDNWVGVKQVKESNNDSTELIYQFRVCQNGVVTDKVSFKIETEDQKTKINLFIVEQNIKYHYIFKEVVIDEKTYIHIHIKEGHFNEIIRVVVTKDEESGELLYEYRLLTNMKSFNKNKKSHPFKDKNGTKRNNHSL